MPKYVHAGKYSLCDREIQQASKILQINHRVLLYELLSRRELKGELTWLIITLKPSVCSKWSSVTLDVKILLS